MAVFLGETLLKIYGLGCGRFWKGEEAVWKPGKASSFFDVLQVMGRY